MNNLPNDPQAYLNEFNYYIKQLLLKFASETQENIESLDHIEFGYSDGCIGLKLKNKEIFVSDIFNALEDKEEAPHEVKEYYPAMTDKEWQSSTRLSTIILVLFESLLKKRFFENLDERIENISRSKNMAYKLQYNFSNK
jgi:hypothetical protein